MGDIAVIADVLSKVGGYGLAGLFAWMWIRERDRNNSLSDARLVDVKDFGMKCAAAIDNNTHAMDRLVEVVKARP
jgi:hypothetical protein